MFRMPRSKVSVDIGASSGVIFLMESNNPIEVHRFKHNNREKFWDLEHIIDEILIGLQKIKPSNKLVELSFCTWGCDYVIVENNKIVKNAQNYRFPDTEDIVKEVDRKFGLMELYRETGIQFQPFNTIFQLIRDKDLFNAETQFLFIGDFLNYYFTGKKFNELTIASTSQLINPYDMDWSQRLINFIGFNKSNFLPIIRPGIEIGKVHNVISRKLGYSVSVISGPSHDTAAAFNSVDDNNIIINSGTWSIIGVNLETPIINIESYEHNFSNEISADGGVRFLKNIMGMWVYDRIVEDLGLNYDFKELESIARTGSHYKETIDINHESLLNPSSMREAVDRLIIENEFSPIRHEGEYLYCILNSLAKSYSESINLIEYLTKNKYKRISLIGGGSNNNLLNELIEVHTNKEIFICESEATSLGLLKELKRRDFKK